jgi:asparagine synthase (glutamine-hydrolysing)
MSGVYGWLGRTDGDAAAILGAMGGRVVWSGPGLPRASGTTDAALGVAGPHKATHVHTEGGLRIAWHGHPFAPGWPRANEADAFARRLAEAYRSAGAGFLSTLKGDFALAIVDESRHRALLAVDRIGTREIVYRTAAGLLVFGPSCDVVASHPATTLQPDPQAIYNYVYFHMVPGPDTAFSGLRRIPAGHFLMVEPSGERLEAYWRMSFLDVSTEGFEPLKQQFRAALRSGVAQFADGSECGTFLSGGTDSSTVSGLLGEVAGHAPRTYSIGFEASGYDEMEYARIAARHFGTSHHEYYVTPADVVDAVPKVAAAYDQPFGNASAVPTYFCAKVAREDGTERILGGDGGDELFGGNARYARQHQFALYERVPAALRSALVEPLLLGVPGTGRVPLLRKARSYVQQASMPMPDRYEAYNLLERLGPDTVFDAGFLAGVDRQSPLKMLRAEYRAAHATSLIDRMLALDLKFTLADNDLPKVTRMCNLAGMDVAFPMLHEDVVAFSGKLSPDMKLRGTKLRYFFKEALRDFLPPEIIAKEKHGFGLPAGVWIRDYPPLRSLAFDSLATLRARGLFRRDFLDSLQGEHLNAHPGYYGTMVWILMMLELWFQKHTRGG